MFRYISLISLIVTLLACTRQETNYIPQHAPFMQTSTSQADSVLLTMTIDEKIGQLLVFQPQLKDSLQVDTLIRLASDNRLGGVILEGLKLIDYISLIDSLQKVSGISLLNGSRNQISLHNQFTDITDLPSAATISAIDDDTLRNTISTYFIDQLSNLGINMSFVPSVNTNNEHSEKYDFNIFENEREAVITYSSRILRAIQNRQVLSVAGDFKDLLYLENDTMGVVDSLLLPYYNLIQNGVSGIQVDPAIFQIDSLHVLPPHFLKRYLNQYTEFDGLLIADWQNEPFQNLAYAGVDLFIIKDSFENRFNTIRKLVNEGLFTQIDLNQRVRKVLMAKSWMGLDTIQPIIDRSMAQLIMTKGFDDYEIRQMYEASLTLLQNPGDLLPFKHTYQQPFQLVEVGNEELFEFQKYLSKYAAFSVAEARPDANGAFGALDFHQYNRSKIIVTLDAVQILADKDSAFIKSMNDLGQTSEVVLVNFGSPLNLVHFDSTIAIVQSYERNPILESLSAQFLFGALQAKGKLPLRLTDSFPYKHGIDNTPIIRMKYTVPEEVGIAAYQLVGIDAIAQNAILGKATPGCQVLVAKSGKIIYSKSFGRHDFENGRLVQNTDLYDLASVTKVAATTVGMMKLYDDGKIKINDALQKHIDMGEDSRLKKVNLYQLLTHKSGLQSNMPIAPFIMYEDTTATGCGAYFCKEKVLSYITPITDSMYMDFKWQDSIWQDVYNLKPRKRKRYLYSDVNFNLLMKVLETKEDTKLDDYMNKEFYNPLNLDRLTYNPLKRFKKRDIIPTAKEERFRKQLIHGYVHDESAALLGGVGGNAGLFGNSESLVPLFQMLLNKGSYGGQQFLKPETVAFFTQRQRGTKRGLGFDLNKSNHPSCSSEASRQTFGHTGFTGTCVWVDPESDLIFIFLSNRIHPDIRNRKLFRSKIRKRMHNLVYDALNTYPEIDNRKSEKKEPEVMHADFANKEDQ